MGFLSRLDVQPSTKIDLIFDDPRFEDEYKAELLYALIDPKYAHTSIARELSADGYQLSETAVRRYREKLSVLVLATQELNDE